MTQPGHSYAASMNPSYIFGQCLLGWDSNTLSVTPQIATEWKWIDELTLELKLREDVTSIAGDPFTAHDVVYTFNLNNETPALAAYYNIFDYEKTVAVNDYTVQIALLQPYPELPETDAGDPAEPDLS